MDSTGYGPKDQTPIESRSDVLVYSTPVLTKPVEVIGKLWFILYAFSNRLDTDFAIRITDVYPDGRSILMARHRHGLDREDMLVPGVPDTFKIGLWSTANVFNAGHRIRVIISSSNYPRFEKNPNTGAPFMRDDPVTLVAENTVYRSPTLPSHLLLPIVPFDTSSIVSKTKIPNEIKLSCSPNPFNSSCKITIDGVGAYRDAPLQIEIYDLRGNIVWQTNLSDSKERPQQSLWRPDKNIASGIYFVRAAMGNEHTKMKRIIYLK